jgi:Ornithine decarboxylase antizyme
MSRSKINLTDCVKPRGLNTSSSPPSAYTVNQAGQGAAHYIRSECERFCCETLKAAFLGEGNTASRDSLVMDAHNSYDNASDYDGGSLQLERSQSQGSLESQVDSSSKTVSFLEIWDYEGGSRFRGFIAERFGKRALFVFFDEGAFGHSLKPGYVFLSHCTATNLDSLMALIELCDSNEVDCSELVICIDRELKVADRQAWMKNFRWVGFEPTTLADWTDYGDITSDKWQFFILET